MNLLAIETATTGCSVALLHNSKISSIEDNSPQSHTKTVLPMIDKLLKDNGLNISKIDAIAFDSGPGSFTGLRIGAGVAQGLALPNNTPIIEISSLEIMAHQVSCSHHAVALDARMNEVYFACFHNNKQIEATIVTPVDKIKLSTEQPWQLIGNGWVEYGVPSSLNKLTQHLQIGLTPHARNLIDLARDKHDKKIFSVDATPTYIRKV